LGSPAPFKRRPPGTRRVPTRPHLLKGSAPSVLLQAEDHTFDTWAFWGTLEIKTIAQHYKTGKLKDQGDPSYFPVLRQPFQSHQFLACLQAGNKWEGTGSPPAASPRRLVLGSLPRPHSSLFHIIVLGDWGVPPPVSISAIFYFSEVFPIPIVTYSKTWVWSC
jgi:hypothetical protein